MSDRPIDAELARISRRIRRWREAEALTPSHLAERSGLEMCRVLLPTAVSSGHESYALEPGDSLQFKPACRTRGPTAETPLRVSR